MTFRRNLNKLQDDNRYYNWYHGYTDTTFPENADIHGSGAHTKYTILTSATSGTIHSQYFGESFDANKVELTLVYKIIICPPVSVKDNTNTTLHFAIELETMMSKLVEGIDRFSINWGDIDPDSRTVSRNFTPPDGRGTNGETVNEWKSNNNQFIELERIVDVENVRIVGMDMMPGFKFTWFYSGADNVRPWAKFSSRSKTFVRNDPIEI